MAGMSFNPEKNWLDRIDRQHETKSRVDLSGPHGIPREFLTEAICIRVFETRRGNWHNKLSDVPEVLRTPAVCLAAIKAASDEASAVPAHVWTPEFIDQALNQGPCGDQLLKHIPVEKVTADIAARCVQINGYVLSAIPDAFKSDALCQAAIRSNGSAIAFVPAHLRTLENFRIAVASNPYGALSAINDNEFPQKDLRELCLIGVRASGLALEEVVKKAPALLDAEILVEAVGQNGYAIRYVPAAMATPTLLTMAVSGDTHPQQNMEDGINGRLIMSSPLHGIAKKWPKRVTEDLCLAAVQHRWQAVVDVPPEFRSARVLLTALKQHSAAWNWIPEHEKWTHPEVAAEWVRQDVSRVNAITNPETFAHVVAQLGLEEKRVSVCAGPDDSCAATAIVLAESPVLDQMASLMLALRGVLGEKLDYLEFGADAMGVVYSGFYLAGETGRIQFDFSVPAWATPGEVDAAALCALAEQAEVSIDGMPFLQWMESAEPVMPNGQSTGGGVMLSQAQFEAIIPELERLTRRPDGQAAPVRRSCGPSF